MNFTGTNLTRVEHLEPIEIKKFHVKNFMNQGIPPLLGLTFRYIYVFHRFRKIPTKE